MAVKNNKNCACKKNDLEQSLVESEEKFRLLMELATDGVLVVQDGKIKEVNYYLAKMCGYTIDEVLDTDLASFFHADDIETIATIYEKPLTDNNALAVHDLTLMCKNQAFKSFGGARYFRPQQIGVQAGSHAPAGIHCRAVRRYRP
jgi:transcriptional regulator with PAS, ATPase and Fis domain